MSNFIERIKQLTDKRKTYSTSEIEVRVKQNLENEFDKEIFIYKREIMEIASLYKYPTFMVRATNIEDDKDIVEYKIIALPTGKTKFLDYLNPEKLDKSKVRFYNFKDLWYKTFGEEISNGRKFTTDELKGFQKIFKAKMEMAKYQCLYELKYKDSYTGERKFKGSKYFGGYYDSNEDGNRIFEQINCDTNIKLQETYSCCRDDAPKELIYELLSQEIEENLRRIEKEYSKEKIKSEIDEFLNLGGSIGRVTRLNIVDGKNEQTDIAMCHRGLFKSYEETPFELINLYTVPVGRKNNEYDAIYFTKEALSKIVELKDLIK